MVLDMDRGDLEKIKHETKKVIERKEREKIESTSNLRELLELVRKYKQELAKLRGSSNGEINELTNALVTLRGQASEEHMAEEMEETLNEIQIDNEEFFARLEEFELKADKLEADLELLLEQSRKDEEKLRTELDNEAEKILGHKEVQKFDRDFDVGLEKAMRLDEELVAKDSMLKSDAVSRPQYIPNFRGCLRGILAAYQNNPVGVDEFKKELRDAYDKEFNTLIQIINSAPVPKPTREKRISAISQIRKKQMQFLEESGKLMELLYAEAKNYWGFFAKKISAMKNKIDGIYLDLEKTLEGEFLKFSELDDLYPKKRGQVLQ